MRGEILKTHRVECPVCHREFTAKGKDRFAVGRLNANLANHMKAAHQRNWKTGKPIPPEIPTVESGPGGKRPYNRKAKPEAMVNFCPGCGCNLRAVKVAMGL